MERRACGVHHRAGGQVSGGDRGRGVEWRLADVIQGGGVRFSLPSPDEAPRDSTMARRSRSDTITTFLAEKSEIAPAGEFLDLFNLTGGQRQGGNAWVNLKSLQEDWMSRSGESLSRRGQGGTRERWGCRRLDKVFMKWRSRRTSGLKFRKARMVRSVVSRQRDLHSSGDREGGRGTCGRAEDTAVQSECLSGDSVVKIGMKRPMTPFTMRCGGHQ